MTLVGLYVGSPDEAGCDAGGLYDLPKTGIIATNAINEIVGLDADRVL